VPTDPTTQSLWQQACAELQYCVTPSAYQTWILNNPLVQFQELSPTHAQATIASPTPFQSATIQKQYAGLITEILSQLSGKQCSLSFVVQSPLASTSPPPAPQSTLPQYSPPTQPAHQNPPTPEVAPQLSYSAPQASTPEIPGTLKSPNHPDSAPELDAQPATPTSPGALVSTLQDRLKQLAKNKPTLANTSPAQPGSPSLFSASTIQGATIDRSRMAALKSGLRPDYTFESFAVSGSNEMAYAAAQAVANHPGQAYNPLFIYGNVGVGKTHLIHAIGNHLLATQPEKRVLYCTGEDFTNEIIRAIQTKKALIFKEKYRSVDVLIVDDVWFIAGRNTVQEEFFHTFNALIKRAGQIILTSDRPPHEINNLEDRLKSRFEAGLMVDIQQPSFELRTAIVLIKAQNARIDLPIDLAQHIASRIDTARKLEGAITRLKSNVELKGRILDTALVEESIKGELSDTPQKLRVKPADVVKVVSEHFHVKQIEIRGKNRQKEIVNARHVAIYILNKDLELSLVEVGRMFNQADHTSSLHATQKIQEQLVNDPVLRQELAAIRTTLQTFSKS
jgi:chromosomal replication initiator protein